MPAHHGKQKQLAKRKKKREAAQRRPRPGGPSEAAAQAQIIREASQFPQGPAFMSVGWRSDDARQPQLVTVVVTRVGPMGMLIPSVALVDRTCLGVKNAFVARPAKRAELGAWLDRIAAVHGGVEEVDLLKAQSVVYHAVDYARSLGFEPHPDFPEPLFGPRPEVLLDTPLARPSRPVYVSGPDDDPARVVAQLGRAVGEGSFDVVAGGVRFDDEEEDEFEEGA